MKNCIIALITLILISSNNLSFAEDLKNSTSKIKTKMEQFISPTGVVIIKGYERIGNVSCIHGGLSIFIKEFINASNNKKEYGVSITVESSKNDSTSYIDYDEIDSLIKGIEYISKIKANITKLTNFEADYQTKDDLKISTFNSKDEIQAVVSSGNINKAEAFLKLDMLENLKNLLIKAKLRIKSIKE